MTQDMNLHVLMVHADPCIRVLKETLALRKRGVHVDVLCANLRTTPRLADAVEHVFEVSTYESIHDFLQQNYKKWDIIHCHNEPNIITGLALDACSERPVIYDCHDMSSARATLSGTDAAVEEICFTRSQGVVHVSEGIKKLAFAKYGAGLSIVLPSFPSASQSKVGAKPTLLRQHVVYQGSMSSPDQVDFTYRFYAPMFQKIVDAGMHMHVFPTRGISPRAYALYKAMDAENTLFHLHSSLPYEDLLATMSQFQWGFSGFNFEHIDTPLTRNFLNSALPNKFFDYLLAGVCPVVINNETTAAFAEQLGVGYRAQNMDDFVRICTTMQPLPPLQDMSVIDMDTQIERLLGLYAAAQKEL